MELGYNPYGTHNDYSPRSLHWSTQNQDINISINQVFCEKMSWGTTLPSPTIRMVKDLDIGTRKGIPRDEAGHDLLHT